MPRRALTPMQVAKMLTENGTAEQIAARYGISVRTYYRYMRREDVPPRELQPCGTDAAYQRHLRKGEIPCEACVVAHRERQRLNRQGISTRPLAPCGTYAAYRRHLYHKQKPDRACAEAGRSARERWRPSSEAGATVKTLDQGGAK